MAPLWLLTGYYILLLLGKALANTGCVCVPSEQFIKRKSKWKSRIFYIKYCSMCLCCRYIYRSSSINNKDVCLKLNFSSKHDEKIWIIMLSVKYDKWNENFNLLCFSSSSHLFTLYRFMNCCTVYITTTHYNPVLNRKMYFCEVCLLNSQN